MNFIRNLQRKTEKADFVQRIVTNFLSFAQFCHFFGKENYDPEIKSYKKLNIASRQDQLNGA